MNYQGGCLCGGVSIEITGPIKHVMHCHCKMCRKAHGSSFASFGLVSVEDFKITGTTNIRTYKSSKNVLRTFCGICSSNIEWIDNSEFNEGYRSFALGLLDTEFVPDSEEHIFVSNEVKWGRSCARLEEHS
ncbi:GFA family protein [Vibrio rotiferianus]|uniref:GFA family protein n=1 Tax=Vibrio rotiferianus TaxID=190895 RepID=UPI001110B20C|nr:GFA family protein [Vibrio rotiferianus]TMX41415.1 GFA family protein [Vibrio rotiferianus]TMX54957.1 GFA family protein [Vibrio rotiferianus]TMX60620.1 GFA family protein [Vibrio rotiferianus]